MTVLAGELLALLREWLPSNDVAERPLMQLATADDEGPDVRSVLLSEWNDSGFFFHTDSRSRKVRQLGTRPTVALAVVSPDHRRQLTVRGTAEVADAADLERIFAARSPYLRQLAWQNSDEVAQLELPERERIWAQFQADHDIAGLAAPETWVGFRVRPSRITFWEANPTAPSRRTEFRRIDDTWQRALLAG